MQDNKYYTPKLEDIHIGYECEFHGITTGGLYFFNDDGSKNEEKSIEPSIKVYYPIRCGLDPWSTDLKPEAIYKSINNNQIRTPYLTKEQIEAEGWEIIPSKLNCSVLKKEDYYVYIFKDCTIQIGKGTPPTWLNYYYKGKCPSINEFRTICKLIGC